MKIRLLEPGFEHLNGMYGGFEFEDALSVEDVPVREAIRMAALMRVEWEDGRIPSMGAEFGPLIAVGEAELEDKSGLSEDTTPRAQLDAADGEGGLTPVEEIVAGKNAPIEVKERYNEAELGAIADKHGIDGLRSVAEKFAVEGKNVNELIQAVLKAQKSAGDTPAKAKRAASNALLMQERVRQITERPVEKTPVVTAE